MRKTHLTNGCKTATRGNAMSFTAVSFWSFVGLPDECRCERCNVCGQMKLEERKLAAGADQWEPETGEAAEAWKTEVGTR